MTAAGEAATSGRGPGEPRPDNPLALAETVAFRVDDSGICPAWVESAERKCGNPATVDYLCDRHHGVATKRLAKRREKDAAALARLTAKRDARRPKAQAELARVEARMAALSPASSGPLDHGVLNTPLRRRALTDNQIAEMAALTERRARLLQEVR